ncbi:helix-turn-helix domain-containing protein [Halobacterium bonnevillei]|uniref:Bacterio-opsin activator n=1 Tax=Halobacterium bonnevillei TaxID=2692200 RepID=A0A6B0SLC0_9EURY|nr:helix-turn-helix domain-containing protein [Halobacterium bonnevillei]MXR20343.1 bacterio-opsin activator [Halobacterium bonnevillei]
MPVLAEISIPRGEFVLGEVFEDYPECTVEFERVVPFDSEGSLLFRVDGSDPGDVASTLSNWPKAARTTLLGETTEPPLFEVELDGGTDRFIDTLSESDVHVFEARGGPESWELQLQFSDHGDLVRFNEQLTEAGIPVTLNRLSNPSANAHSSLSTEQREAVSLAYRHGYFEVPRNCTIQDLADEVGISDSAFSQRLRRGVGICVQETLGIR